MTDTRRSLTHCLKECEEMSPAIKSTFVYKFARIGIASAVLALALGGCAAKRSAAVDIQAEIPDNYQERHPIVLGDVSKSLDVFLVPNSGIDHRQAEDVRTFAKEFKSNGKGALVATLPHGAPSGAVQHTLREIRRTASAAGVPGDRIRVAHGATHPSAASVRLSFSQLDARVASRCGQWPHDPAGSTTLQSFANRPHYNLGCSYQSMMAAQMANPVDMVRARPEGPYDMERRLQAIDRVREGQNPATNWPTETTKINANLQ